MRSAEVDVGRARRRTAAAGSPARPAAAAGALPDLTGIAQRAIDSVTNISSTQVRRRTPLTNDPFFRFFFRDDDLYQDRPSQQSLGSGVVVSRDGYVLTNNHVVGGATARDDQRGQRRAHRQAGAAGEGRRHRRMTDIAVLKIDAHESAGAAAGEIRRS